MKRIVYTLFYIVVGCLAVEAATLEKVFVKKDDLTNRRALVGEDCLVNQFAVSANLLTNYKNMEAVTDEDLTNFATITGVSAGVGERPIFSVKDLKHVYEAGTTAGFSVVSTEGGGLLTLELIKMFTISYYLDGKLMGTQLVKEGQSGTGLGLDLIKLPNTDAVSVDLTITPKHNFDEIYLHIGGVDVAAIQELSVKYAFVGDSKEYPLTHSSLKNNFNGAKVILNKCDAMPWPVGKSWLEGSWRDDTVDKRILDDDLENKLGTGFLAIGEWCHVKIATDHTFEAGTEVGFKYESKGLLNLNLGGYTLIQLFDENGKKVQEETVKAGILGLGVAEGGVTKTSIIAKQPFSQAKLVIGAAVGLSLGEAAGIYYGFVKKKPDVSHRCPIQATTNSSICGAVGTMQLDWNKRVEVKWSVEKSPEGSQVKVDENTGFVTGLDIDGVYTFKATAVNCKANPQCFETVSIRKGGNDAEEHHSNGVIINPTDQKVRYAISDKIHESSGSLLSISDMKNPASLLDASFNNYATYRSGLGIANDLCMVGLKTIDGQPFQTETQTKAAGATKRVGFVVENASTFLDAKVLEYFQIRLYRNGKRVEGKGIPLVIEETNTIGVGLIGAEKSQKVRYSIEVPASTEFDEFQLWKSGVLDLGLSSLRVFYGFVESSANYVDPVNNSSTTIISRENTNARLSIDIPFQTVAAAQALTDAYRLIDNDMDSSMMYMNTVGVGTGVVLKVKLGRMADKRQQLGIAISNNTYVAGVGVGSWMTVSTWRNGVEQEKFTNWNTVGLDVIGLGDKKFLLSQPVLPYDEVHIALAGVVGALDGQHIYGIFLRDDLDRDGLPDYMDPECCPEDLSDLTITDHICLSKNRDEQGQVVDKWYEYVEWSGLMNFEYIPKPGETVENTGPVYTLELFKLPDQQTAVYNETLTLTKTVDGPELYSWRHKVEDPGRYLIKLKKQKNLDTDMEEEHLLSFTAHPHRTKWMPQTAEEKKNDWNSWDNWDRGTPWNCTEVIIPSDATSYPILMADTTNICQLIHFEPHAEVVNTHHLEYQKAWVDLLLKPNRYYMVTVPLKHTVSGDWFITSKKNDDGTTFVPDTFAFLNESTYPANRVTPTIYQRVWEKSVRGRLPGGATTTVYPTHTRWTRPSNALNHSYDAVTGAALSVWVHPGTPVDQAEGAAEESYLFRFPKKHQRYHYCDESGKEYPNLYEQITRDRDLLYGGERFIYEEADGSVRFPVRQEARNLEFTNKTFLFANPFMSHIDMAKFIEGNPGVTSVKVYDAKGNNALVEDREEGFVSATGTDQLYVAPMQSFFVTVQDDGMESDRFEVQFTEEMLCSVPKDAQLKSSSSIEKHSLRLTAQTAQAGSSALIRFAAGANDHFEEREDAEALIDEEATPDVVLFTVADEHALDIQQRRQGGTIPLGFYMGNGSQEVTLTVQMPEAYAGWLLEDIETGKSYPLAAGENRIALGRLTTQVGRFCLRGSSAVANEGITARPAKIYACRDEEGMLTVRSAEGMMKRCETFTVEGRRVSVARYESDFYRLPAVKGVMVIKVYLADGRMETLKLVGY